MDRVMNLGFVICLPNCVSMKLLQLLHIDTVTVDSLVELMRAWMQNDIYDVMTKSNNKTARPEERVWPCHRSFKWLRKHFVLPSSVFGLHGHLKKYHQAESLLCSLLVTRVLTVGREVRAYSFDTCCTKMVGNWSGITSLRLFGRG